MSDFGGLKSILDEMRETAREEYDRELTTCPLCGERLDENSRGFKNCPLGHFQAPSGATWGTHGNVR